MAERDVVVRAWRQAGEWWARATHLPSSVSALGSDPQSELVARLWARVALNDALLGRST
jgi:hypothetical protein